ncbi:biotin-dependent carboxyltransferase family protein [Pseudomonas sp. GD03944]|uniref:5-oxoprolinase subunit C family protein n=1 Tax=Pseudomonas sp. GD03944 TaxID=2975409 RepID=UPI002446DDAB|nr:biotin-dependent carboxyltransferase family protein [Pseudomonas sp. GD03944]MDH1261616.1 biotin-dependent carboxyltransferase family protein [Pseudomonas sp. GD03944]
MSLEVIRSTPFIQLQDGGRFGVRHLGVTQSGALDWVSLYWANWLLGNPLAAAVLEIPLGGLELHCQQDATLALAGADLGATLDGQPLAPWRSFRVRQGQQLKFAQPRQGARAYLAAPGGFEAPQVLGSCASVAREELGGLQGNGAPIAAGDQLRWSGQAEALREVPTSLVPVFGASPRLELVMGAQHSDFSGQSLFDVFNSAWKIDLRADRMGVRLLGPVLQCQRTTMVSEGIPLGAVQVPPDGQPIILLNDRQTIGGYPRLGALTPLAVARLAQCLPGETLQLRPMLQASAQDAHRALLGQWQAR